ncbi:3-oxoacyl-(acyl-carrier-protein) reductase [Deinococcus grandis]|uniref:3-oxoacyl-(Acyl-carrier-protein) reductase n=1 Tax=Deinococcus grandis TaxID=57498 RepID=A0A100HNE4_9DEIO|nr:hypothetical protein [Deinococcus grandis]GAQ23921.1 3-oxoacyl-(acyl-carrier-protein) reductase [Deinococcus grandis]
MPTIITLNNVQFDPGLNLPLLPLDAYDGPGVLLIHDYRRARCLAPGVLTEGQLITNLSRNVTAGIDAGDLIGAAGVTRDGQGLRFSRPNGAQISDWIRATGLGALPLQSGVDWVATVWVRQRAAVDWQGVIGSAGNSGSTETTNSWGLYIQGSGGLDPYGITARAWTTAGALVQYGLDHPLPVGGPVVQLAFGMTFSGGAATMHWGYNGGLQIGADVGAWRVPQYPLQIGTAGTDGQSGATIYRATLAQVGAGRRYASIAEAVARDYALGAGQFG